MTSLELLAPAKNLECGIAAIDHGADAVYIGAPRFGARAAAGNSVDDIATLCRYAHQFGAKVYVTVNTIIYDSELADTRQLLGELQQAGVDAVLVQDMGLKPTPERPTPQPLPVREGSGYPLQQKKHITPLHTGRGRGVGPLGLSLHASTQTDNRTPEKVRWLQSLGFRRVVLARELSLEEIREIHRQVPDVELEVFVHGALCVSYSGQCYMSQYCLGRSANRGECAQMCRMKYDLLDADGREIEHQRHLLSLKDMCRIDSLEELADAGAVSFKIEGRLKDVAYVKNVVAAYSQRLDALCAKRPNDYRRASQGRVTYTFKPDLRKTFNRGFTDYFLHAHRDEHGSLQGRQRDIASFDTPKALGEYVGKVKEVRRDSFTVAGTAAFANGDGLCFFKEERSVDQTAVKGNQNYKLSIINYQLTGFRVNRAAGNRLYPLRMPEGLRPGMALYRNNDVVFERLMAGKTAERRIPVRMQLATFAEEGGGLQLTADTGFAQASVRMPADLGTLAQKPQGEYIAKELSKLGNTPFVCDGVDIPEGFNVFVRASQLSELRRQVVSKLMEQLTAFQPDVSKEQAVSAESVPVPPYSRPYLYNIANEQSKEFYQSQGVRDLAPALELSRPSDAMLMQCRYCLRYTLGYCVKHGGRKPTWREPLTLRLGDGREFRLEFDCRQCQMNIYSK
ncbi:MAG: U32 family peptidase [Prevotella sp.]|nr:U32 family peptidase [Prevotella sp.]